MTVSRQLEAAHEAFERADWTAAHEVFSAALGPEHDDPDDLRRAAEAAILTGHLDEGIARYEVAHHRYLDHGDVGTAARCTFWLGMQLMLRGQQAPAMGWFGRGQRLLDDADADVVERGYLMTPSALATLYQGEPADALESFREITHIADRFEDPDLMALGRLGQGQALVAMGDADAGTAMLDEAMVAVTTGDVSALAAGIVYCGLVTTCRKVFDLRRAREWTAALSDWCDQQEGLQPYRGQCLVHRSEIMQLQGSWDQALEEVELACDHLADPVDDPVMGMAQYQRGELLRLRGEFDRAEACYRRAGEWGHRVHPGLALLRLSQGRVDEADAAIRRVVAEAGDDQVRRAQVLAAFAEITLAAGDADAARQAADELEQIARDFGAPYLHAVATAARGSLLLADGDAAAAQEALRHSQRAWQEIGAPYEVASVRLRMAEAYRALGDDDTAQIELDAARRVFEELGAAPAAARARELAGEVEDGVPGDLTPRELEVIGLVATGATNRAIAEELVISEKTVARHVSNIFVKLDVSSRSAATAWAYEHDLV
ncbi:MAG: helix-turn-helix transcriptional regulator [Nitriliruptorales bacterium]|nr:helix-turn-helix transcriptional regulator [Nitriliruptorales bacterium]